VIGSYVQTQVIDMASPASTGVPASTASTTVHQCLAPSTATRLAPVSRPDNIPGMARDVLGPNSALTPALG
jgi:hypothetical protein